MSGVRRQGHITPITHKLHCLPVRLLIAIPVNDVSMASLALVHRNSACRWKRSSVVLGCSLHQLERLQYRHQSAGEVFQSMRIPCETVRHLLCATVACNSTHSCDVILKNNTNSLHILKQYLPDRPTSGYSLRPRRHNKTLITKHLNLMIVILLSEIFTNIYIDFHTY